jgi:hypothetical protein
MTYLLNTVPLEFRSFVLARVPFGAAAFPLASDSTAIDTRRKARSHFMNCAEVARELGCPATGMTEEEFALWIQLRDPYKSAAGLRRLRSKLRETNHALRLVPLSLQFGVELDLEAVHREIERETAINGGMTLDAASARVALAFTQKTPQDAANYIERHRDQLAEKLDKREVVSLEIEMLIRAGLPEKAAERLAILENEADSGARISHFQNVISGLVANSDPAELLREQFKRTNALADLSNLVNALEAKREWDELSEYCTDLFDRTGSLRDAERLANALSETQRDDELIEFVKMHRSFLDQSNRLRMLYCWSLYYEGVLLAARTELKKLKGLNDDPKYRALEINLGIRLGDWNSLLEFVSNDFRNRANLGAHDLFRAAQMGFHLGSPQAKALLFAAVRKCHDEADILAAAYFLASTGGWEDDPEVAKWLQRAAELSSDSGPIQKMSLKDVLGMKPDWDRHESDIWRQLNLGRIPICLAAQALNRSLVDLYLLPALVNPTESDPRRRAVVPAFGGNREPRTLNAAKIVGIEATALVTLKTLNLLERTLEVFDRVFIPHSTFAWLFEEKQRATFHQPSLIRDAKRLGHLLTMGILEKLVPNTIPDSDLANQVGDELALLITEAQQRTADGGQQSIVVRPAPVHRVGSLMDEEADLARHAPILSSCLPLAKKLREGGQITASEEKGARAFLRLHEKPWPNQPEVTDGAELYLDDLAIHYFLKLGLIERLHSYGFRLFISPSKALEINRLIAYEGISNQASQAIDEIREKVSVKIESGDVAIGRSVRSEGLKNNPIFEHPTLSIMELSTHCESIIVDDRFINQHDNINYNKKLTPVFTTLDLLNHFHSDGTITQDEWFEHRTFLRRAGYLFVPITAEELQHHLEDSAIGDERMIESAELRAIRENTLQARMGNWLQLPKEAFWFDSTIVMCIRSIKKQWQSEADMSCARARSDWLVELIDVRGWAHCFGEEGGVRFINAARGAHILMLLSPPEDTSQDTKNEYWAWVEGRFLSPIKEQDSELYSWILEKTREKIATMSAEFEGDGDQ